MSAVAATTAVPGGFAIWSVTEYLSHRFGMHTGAGRTPMAREHRRHHGQPEATAWQMRLGGYAAMAAAAGLAAAGATRIVSRSTAVGLSTGWFGGYAFYELSHWFSHHRAPRTTWGRRLRTRHFRHHFGAPRSNLGVTTSLWDRIAGTEVDDDGPVRVPRRLAMDWLVEDGEIRAGYHGEYVLTGRRALDEAQREDDLARAYADRPPLTD
ncbi:MAG: sterol desaturase family protein [Acidimicrobiales bacterium]